jgi:hypothetical protein
MKRGMSFRNFRRQLRHGDLGCWILGLVVLVVLIVGTISFAENLPSIITPHVSRR